MAIGSGCTTYAVIDNQSVVTTNSDIRYGLEDFNQHHRSNDEITLVVAFSGGGGRAAALAYGVMQGLRDSNILAEIDMISSVSGGSFTAAYYGLYGDKLFTDFENDFIRRDYQTEWLTGLANPLQWFSSRGRTDIATQIYEERLFKGATFADLHQANGPLIVINATDLGGGARFSFLQEYFDLLCSDLSSYPIARAVTASSAVPIMLNPVVLRNHSGCINPAQDYLQKIEHNDWAEFKRAPGLIDTVEALNNYQDKQQRPYIHLVDGGITDNLGLMALYEMVEIGGGINSFVERLGSKPTPRLVVISVNASAKPAYAIEATHEIPSIDNTVSAVTDIQLHRYNAATISVMSRAVERWSRDLSDFWQPVEPYFIEISFAGVQQEQQRLLLNQIPTGLALTPEQADALILAGRELLQNHPEFQRLLQQLNND
ncbi:patatin-like phospholipase family protein [Pseudidiomarina mangrovi]|uniref:patatin-like phospholipase family protein n=1 Tax=Pseudidiomarina mangrovi TaxID=2487133 RepID=UPI0013E08E39|nr:patatin-like phospholipase family protein [Pseudidiomarina mangrovi]